MLAYGIYSDLQRQDNDYQVILQYAPEIFDLYGRPLRQTAPHYSGPERSEARYFLYTGNTTYGIQNLEYDPFSCTWMVAVYKGQKECFTNFPLFFIDGKISGEEQRLTGRGAERGRVLSLAQLGEAGAQGIRGSRFPLGATGICSLGDGRVYFSRPLENPQMRTFASQTELYRINPDSSELFERISV